MPLDEVGAKWSCEPCIRGHRSSKCQHFDRLMMKVPKAGRPLAKCPHPKGTCSCQKLYAFMIRIPKGSTCLCRPVYQVPVDPNDSAPTTAPTPLAPTASPAPGKIQKSSRRQIKTAPENIAKALDSIPEFGKQCSNNGTSINLSPYMSQDPGLGGMQSDMPQGVGAPGNFLPQQTLSNGEDSKPQGQNCCSRDPQPPVQPKPQASCCKKPDSSTTNGHSVEPTTDGLSAPSMSANYTPISAPPISSWQDFHAAGQNHYYQPFLSHQPPSGQPAYVSDYMLHSAPKAAAMGFPHQNINDGFTQSAMPQSISNDRHSSGYTAAATFNNDPRHDCSCGDNCQCLGCASHPFNNTTRQHVQEMGLLVAFDGEDQTLNNRNGYQTPILHSKRHSPTPLDYSYTNFNHPLPNGSQSMMMMHSYGDQTSASNNIGNGYSSPPTEYVSEPQLMEPSEYYTLEYPVGLPSGCSDVTGSCLCGNDCSCVGCLTHSGHNGLSLEPATTEARNLSSIAPVTSEDNLGISMSTIRALNDISVPSSSPML
ncbi:hypothetical protein BDV29DRAFT_175938 [Aspergillus leporis]|uniref:Copper-fist domain-containing protein n=1 Tax=Aspergillus leporis TaxID=41062 RepID=A0A5N5WX61_9EURO|nr:hypothetical protein BDV29DRAFT_175938 [Aspergillus leporis]